MAVCNKLMKDNGNLVSDICAEHLDPGTFVLVEINLPEYLDITSLLALQKRMAETVKVTGMNLRLLAKTSNLAVEKYATRIFADRDDIFLTVDWRDGTVE